MTFLSHLTLPAEADLVVAFSDLTRFARVAQERTPADLLRFLSGYYESAADILEQGGGLVVKCMGDALLTLFPPDGADRAVEALLALQEEGDAALAAQGLPCRHVIKAHRGPVAVGRVGPRSDKRLDVFGRTVNAAATLPSRGVALTPPVFRSLGGETRRLFKKHTPPVTYIPVGEPHRR